jgi:phosphoglycerate dehydrogenase-like enzyme
MKKLIVLEREHSEGLALFREALQREVPDLSVVYAATTAQALAAAEGATALCTMAQNVTAELVAAMPALDWIQALTTGIDPLLTLNLGPGVVVTSARGIHGPQMSELGLLLMLSLARSFPRMLHNQQQAAWERWPQPLLQGKTVGIVGVGTISVVLAGYCKALGVRVVGVSDSRTMAPGFDAIEPRSRLGSVAAAADFLVVLAPLTPESDHLISADVLRQMRPQAFLINLARGRVVDEAALIGALQRGEIAGAGLDVFETEPLPPESPLWHLPNVIVTPHVGGLSDIYARQLLPLVLHNARAYLAGDFNALQNRVQLPEPGAHP